MRIPALAMSLVFLASTALAECPSWQTGDLTVSAAWSRATIGMNRPAVFYATISNSGTEDDALLDIATPVSRMPMLHETVVTDGIASMPHVMRIPVPAGGSIALAPGGYHGMLMDLTQALAPDETYPMVLTFEKAGEVTVDVAVAAMTARGPECLTDAN